MTFSPVANVCVVKHKKEYRRDYYKKNNIDHMSESSKTQDIEKKLQMLLTKKNLDSNRRSAGLRVTGSGFITVKN